MADKKDGSEPADAASLPFSDDVPSEITPPSSPASAKSGLQKLGISPLTPEERAAKRDALLRRQKESRALDVTSLTDDGTATGDSSATKSDVFPSTDALSSSVQPDETQNAAKSISPEDTQRSVSPSPPSTPSVLPDRTSVISQAVAFLSSPSVRNAPMERQTDFLKRKGLSTEEIEYARTKCSEKLDSTTSLSRETDATPMAVNAGLPPPIPARTDNTHYWEPQMQHPLPALMATQLNYRRSLAIMVMIASIGFGSVAALVQHLAGEASGRFRAARSFIIKLQYFRLSFFTTLMRAVGALYAPLHPSIRKAEEKAVEERENILKGTIIVGERVGAGEIIQDQTTTVCTTLENSICMEPKNTIATILESRQKEFMNALSRVPQIAKQLVSTKGECNKGLQSAKSVASTFAEELAANGRFVGYLNRIGSQMEASDSATEELQKCHRVAVDGLKGEIRSAKGLLLSRKNFRSPAPSSQPPSVKGDI